MAQSLVAAEVYDRLQQVMASDPEGFCELYRDYLSDARQTMNHLRALLEQQSLEELRFTAHYLKSSSLVLGVRPVADLCTELESSAKASEFTAAARSLQALADLLSLVERELEQKLGPQVIPATV